MLTILNGPRPDTYNICRTVPIIFQRVWEDTYGGYDPFHTLLRRRTLGDVFVGLSEELWKHSDRLVQIIGYRDRVLHSNRINGLGLHVPTLNLDGVSPLTVSAFCALHGYDEQIAVKKRFDDRDQLLKPKWHDAGEYINSAIWYKIRRVLRWHLTSDCSFCNHRKATQHHHVCYSPWNILGHTIEDILPLCDPCHHHLEKHVTGEWRSPLWQFMILTNHRWGTQLKYEQFVTRLREAAGMRDMDLVA